MADSLATDRLVLRPPTADDLPFLLAEMNTPMVMRYLGGEVFTEADVTSRLQADIDAFGRDDGWKRWTIFRRDDNARVGRCGLFRVRMKAAPDALRGQPEIGWTLAEAYWGKGFATEAARAVLNHAFADLPEVYAQTSDSNAASTRVMQRLGFERRHDLGYVDPDYPPRDNPTTVWSLTTDAWGTHG
ncbi:GNAT family N-acetyltransferase [Aurantiacibacter arachoides]|uniref:GNAT family N-acetyltransferase n=1 Tax=Aurantiacibacter arachoides TaxID=1850444 RepID=UPI0019A2E27B|nr:GNAT family N-acetyltransferase [Aurantiacibacter arachoides]GGD61645.1 N-acetyltransferase [Aurantiacibacter arachoides]